MLSLGYLVYQVILDDNRILGVERSWVSSLGYGCQVVLGICQSWV